MAAIRTSERAMRAAELEVVAAKIAASAANLPQIEEGTPEQARLSRAERGNPFAPEPCELASISSMEIPITRGKVAAKCYVPQGYQSSQSGSLIFYHGGGYVLFSVEDYDTITQRIANFSGCKVFSIDYELAPDNKINSIHQDGYDAYRWIREHSAELDIDPEKIAIGGDSAGGNLAVAVTLACKRDAVSMPTFQVLIYPWVDPQMQFPSVDEFASGLFLTRKGMTWFRSHYLESADQATDPQLQFLQQDLSGLPAAFVITAGFDPLRDEGQAYADRLKSHGIKVEHVCYTDMIHGFISFAGGIEAGEHALRTIGGALRQAVG